MFFDVNHMLICLRGNAKDHLTSELGWSSQSLLQTLRISKGSGPDPSQPDL